MIFMIQLSELGLQKYMLKHLCTYTHAHTLMHTWTCPCPHAHRLPFPPPPRAVTCVRTVLLFGSMLAVTSSGE